MRINRFQDFLNGLDQISSSGYLTMNGDEYVVTYQKSKKTLNTRQIVDIAEQYFSYLDIDRTSLWLHREKLSILSSRLLVYSNRVVKAKSRIWRALAFVGIRSWSEIKIYFLVIKIFAKIQLKQSNLHSIYKDIHKTLQQPENVLKEFYFKVLGSSSLKSKILNLNGFCQSDAFFSIIRDVYTFINQFSSSETKSLITQVINELYFAFEIAREDSKALSQFQKVKKIKQRLANLPINNNANLAILYTNLLLPGGYSGSSALTNHGHAVTYQIIKQENKLFSFCIINSGKGNQVSSEDERMEVDELVCKEKIEIVKERCLQTFDKVKRGKLEEEIKQLKLILKSLKIARGSTDLVFKDLTLNQLSDEFFTELLEYRFNDKKCFSMDSLIQMIEKHLKGSTGIWEGRKHSLQKWGKGNCTIKSITLWLHDRWGRDIHRHFKAYITKQQIEKLNHFIKNKNPQELENYFKNYLEQQSNSLSQDFDIWQLLQQMQKAGFQVLQAREAKLLY